VSWSWTHIGLPGNHILDGCSDLCTYRYDQHRSYAVHIRKINAASAILKILFYISGRLYVRHLYERATSTQCIRAIGSRNSATRQHACHRRNHGRKNWRGNTWDRCRFPSLFSFLPSCSPVILFNHCCTHSLAALITTIHPLNPKTSCIVYIYSTGG